MNSAHARNSDPITSHKAADSVNNITDLQNRILQLFESAKNGYTDEELVRQYAKDFGSYFPSSDSSIRSRRHELEVKGFLRDSGQKRLTKMGRESVVWANWQLNL